MSLFYYSIYLFLYCFIRYLSFCFRGAKIRIISGNGKKRCRLMRKLRGWSCGVGQISFRNTYHHSLTGSGQQHSIGIELVKFTHLLIDAVPSGTTVKLGASRLFEHFLDAAQ